ncbi:MAG: thioesterase [Thermonema sp.]|uniref:PaaI family thioesterase n=1 Tax=Thermonema TaxID=28194 RepID=UPI00056FC130|nr:MULTISPECIES: hotdog fold thioesterase [Thermonema]GIV40609.1 MAG: thioesterase [Thermonema sp.]
MSVKLNQQATLDALHARNKGTMSDFLGIEFTEIGENYLCGKMPVTERSIQPLGILHGGANVVFAETLGSVAANFAVDREKYYCVGLEVNANHLRPVPKGQWIYGRAEAIHLGRTTQVWEIRITNEEGKLTCISRLTMAVKER